MRLREGNPLCLRRRVDTSSHWVGAVYGGYVAILVGFPAGALYNVCALEANLPLGLKAEVLLGRIEAEVLTLDVQLFAKQHLALAGGGIGSLSSMANFATSIGRRIISHRHLAHSLILQYAIAAYSDTLVPNSWNLLIS